MRKGFTLIEAIITILVLVILATGVMTMSEEAVQTAKAQVIIENLQTLRKATWAWYIDNKSNVQSDGRVKIDGKIKPIQEWTGEELGLKKYLDHLGATNINLNTKSSSSGTSRQNTNITKGNYGVCDKGTERNENNEVIANHRLQWYVGYCFNDGEKNVMRKIAGKMKPLNLQLGTADAHIDSDDEKAAAVWLRVL